MNRLDHVLAKLENLVRENRFEQLETDSLEIKSVPAGKGSWKQVKISANAFLNTRGGIIILGIEEEAKNKEHRYKLTGWREEAEGQVREICKGFKDRQGNPQDLKEFFPAVTIRPILDKQIAVIYVDELPADRKFVFHENVAYKRSLTGDHKITENEISAQEEYREEWKEARELQIMPGTSLNSLDLEKLNDYILRIDRLAKIETVKATLKAARPFLERKTFMKSGEVTLLGMLVCGAHPNDVLGFRCQVHGYVETPGGIVQDKQVFADNILPLMDSSYNYLLRSILVGIGTESGGAAKPQYPDELIRETVNNALAHRNYAINKQAYLAVHPGRELSIRNPGSFRPHLKIEALDDPIPIRRIIPEAKPRNPKLADVLRVYIKWEGRGIGMATMVNLCLENKIDLPYYRLHSEEVELVIRSGKLVGERMERLFVAFDRYIEVKLDGNPLTQAQKQVLAYLIRSEWDNELHRYTILLTPDNNHFEELIKLERAKLISKHSSSTSLFTVYVADRTLVVPDHIPLLRSKFGTAFDRLDPLAKSFLSVVHRHNEYSKKEYPSAKQVSFALWYDQDKLNHDDVRAFDEFYRGIRKIAVKLLHDHFVIKASKFGYKIDYASRPRQTLVPWSNPDSSTIPSAGKKDRE